MTAHNPRPQRRGAPMRQVTDATYLAGRHGRKQYLVTLKCEHSIYQFAKDRSYLAGYYPCDKCLIDRETKRQNELPF